MNSEKINFTIYLEEIEKSLYYYKDLTKKQMMTLLISDRLKELLNAYKWQLEQDSKILSCQDWGLVFSAIRNSQLAKKQKIKKDKEALKNSDYIEII